MSPRRLPDAAQRLGLIGQDACEDGAVAWNGRQLGPPPLPQRTCSCQPDGGADLDPGVFCEKRGHCRPAPYRAAKWNREPAMYCPDGSAMCRHEGIGEPATAKLAHGCRHVFVDVGSNRGVHLRFLMEPERFPDSSYLGWSYFSRHFGPHFASDPGICAFAFEPNPVHSFRLQMLARHWRGRGRRVEVVHAAVANCSGVARLFHQWSDNRLSEWSFGITDQHNHSHVEVVPSVRLASFLAQEVLGRRAGRHSRSLQGDTLPLPPAVVLKLDIEGGELEVLQDMWRSGVLCNLSLVTVEFHRDLWPAGPWAAYRSYAELMEFMWRHRVADRNATRTIEYLRTRENRLAERRALPGTRRAECPVRIADSDDESYALVPDETPRPWEASKRADTPSERTVRRTPHAAQLTAGSTY